MHKEQCILAINGGSSSIKFALFNADDSCTELIRGELENIGSKNSTLSHYNVATKEKCSIPFNAANHTEAAGVLISFLEKENVFESVIAIGHRIVHGMKHTAPEKITTALIDDLKAISAFDPEHLPEEIKLITLFMQRCPALVQVACFDTAFHTTMPAIAKMLSIPRKYFNKGIQRYGFHGLSYAYLLQQLEKIAGKAAVHGKVILAHLGSGASLAAIKDGKSVDTTMGFTPAAGLTMGTRSGDLDPGVAWYLMQFEKLTPKMFNHLVNHEAGLLGISETSADMRQLMALESKDTRAAEAIELFCYQAKKYIGSCAAVLGGLETLVFSGGIGEHSPEVRSRICDGLEFLGIELDEIKNMNNERTVSLAASKVTVYVIKTNEEAMIASLVGGVLNEDKE